MRWVGVGWIAVVFLSVIVLLVTDSMKPPENMSISEAEKHAYNQLRVYCRSNGLDITRFGKPALATGEMARGDEFSPTWDFYYTYDAKPSIKVLISYDFRTRTAEVVRSTYSARKRRGIMDTH